MLVELKTVSWTTSSFENRAVNDGDSGSNVASIASFTSNAGWGVPT